VSRHALPLNELKQSVAMLREKPSEADKTRTLYRSMGFESGGEYLRALVDKTLYGVTIYYVPTYRNTH